jgi:hypothetical protein
MVQSMVRKRTSPHRDLLDIINYLDHQRIRPSGYTSPCLTCSFARTAAQALCRPGWAIFQLTPMEKSGKVSPLEPPPTPKGTFEGTFWGLFSEKSPPPIPVPPRVSLSEGDLVTFSRN